MALKPLNIPDAEPFASSMSEPAMQSVWLHAAYLYMYYAPTRLLIVHVYLQVFIPNFSSSQMAHPVTYDPLHRPSGTQYYTVDSCNSRCAQACQVQWYPTTLGGALLVATALALVVLSHLNAAPQGLA